MYLNHMMFRYVFTSNNSRTCNPNNLLDYLGRLPRRLFWDSSRTTLNSVLGNGSAARTSVARKVERMRDKKAFIPLKGHAPVSKYKVEPLFFLYPGKGAITLRRPWRGCRNGLDRPFASGNRARWNPRTGIDGDRCRGSSTTSLAPPSTTRGRRPRRVDRIANRGMRGTANRSRREERPRTMRKPANPLPFPPR